MSCVCCKRPTPRTMSKVACFIAVASNQELVLFRCIDRTCVIRHLVAFIHKELASIENLCHFRATGLNIKMHKGSGGWRSRLTATVQRTKEASLHPLHCHAY